VFKFDSIAAKVALEKKLYEALLNLQEEALKDAQTKMKTPRGAKGLNKEEIKKVASILTGEIIGNAWSVLDEFGKGSLMDRDNPALDDYINSDFWNPLRDTNDLAVRGRPKGSYIDFFGNKRESSGRLAGVNLEALAEQGKLPQSFLPQYPSHALRDAIRWIGAGRIQKILSNVIVTFPWLDYFVPDK
jgi:hypothetical protein